MPRPRESNGSGGATVNSPNSPRAAAFSHRSRLIRLLGMLLLASLLGLGWLQYAAILEHWYHHEALKGSQYHDLPANTVNSRDLLRQQNSTTTKSSASNTNTVEDNCQTTYNKVKSTFTPGLTRDDLDRSRALTGNRYRLSQLANKLTAQQQPTLSVVCGGSITLAHGVNKGLENRYSSRLEAWLNEQYPVASQTVNKHPKHVVLNKGSHGADICAMSKRLHLMMLDVAKVYPNRDPDLIVLEFAVNDYQGQDHKVYVDHKTDVFFHGFQRLALCAETVVFQLLEAYPQTAVVFFEFQTAIENRKTAALLHMGVAQHYQIPVISYADVLMPDMNRLRRLLEPYNYHAPSANISKPSTIHSTNAIVPASLILPYPHGCSPCDLEGITEQFRHGGCKSLCLFAMRSGHKVKCEKDKGGEIAADSGLEPCYLPFFAHDPVHPSIVGHQIAADLIGEAIARTTREVCQGMEFAPLALPPTGFLVDDPALLGQTNAFVLVQDTMRMFATLHKLEAFNHSAGFEFGSDGFRDRTGWIATNKEGGETITFRIDLPTTTGDNQKQCYAIYVAALNSYENMGTFTVRVTDEATNVVTTKDVDGLWEPRISIPQDVQITPDDWLQPPCTGKCLVTVTTHSQLEGRGGNKVKLMTLSARKCVKDKKLDLI